MLKIPAAASRDIQITALPQLKAARPWYAGIDSTVLQQNIKRLDIAYKNCFEGRGFPKFKNRSNFTSFTYGMGVKTQGSKIYLPKLGWMRFYNSRNIPDGFTIKAATIRQRQDGWYVSLRIEDKTVPDLVAKSLTEVKSVIGCDLGITKLVHLSDGHQFPNPKFGNNKSCKHLLKVRQRRVNRKVKGSNNRKKASFIVGRLHKKIADKRQARSMVGSECCCFPTSRCYCFGRLERLWHVASLSGEEGYNRGLFAERTIQKSWVKSRYLALRLGMN